MRNKKELDQKLLEACTSDNIDLAYVEQLLKDGANPLGCVEDDGENDNLYDMVLYHFLDLEQADKDDCAFIKITELFLKYGMDITQPEMPYDHDDSINPMWSFAFYSSEAALQSLKLLLDRGLDADSAGICWGHELTDVGFAGFEVDNNSDCAMAAESFKKLMLFASYPHIISVDDDLKREIWYDENNYDVSNFRDWNRYEYVFEPTVHHDLNKSIVKIFDKATKKEVWKFGFELSPEEWKA